MARSPQSRFKEGSMNDRTSNAPPPDYLGPDAEDTPEYERQFALDWKAPDLSSNQPGNRSSVKSSSSSGTSTAPTSSRVSSAWIKGHKQATSSTSGFLAPLWGGVKERLTMTRSKSSNIIPSLSSSSAIDDESSGDFVPPTFKHRRSESTNTANIIRGKETPGKLNTGFLSPGNESPKLKKAPSVATLPAGGINNPTTYDPSKRPTREEIQASYQSLVASGFFGNRAIQSTRFAPPGQNQSRPSMPVSPPNAARISKDGQDSSLSLPPPQRQPPPPPLRRIASGTPGLPTDPRSPSCSPTRTPVIETVVLSPVSKDLQASWDMPPPPSPPKQRILRHKPSMSFSSMLRSSKRPADEPRVSRGFRPPPLSHTRYSFDSGRRSFDVQREKDPDDMRGLKRPFTATNDSFMAIAGRPCSDVIRNAEREKAANLTEDGGHESGARKLVKKLRKSASRLSIDLGRSISRPTSIFSSDGDANGSGPLSPTREPLSAAIRRSFSWRLGKPGPEAATPEPKGSHDNSNSRNGHRIAREVVTPEPAPGITIGGRYLAPSLAVITGSPASPDRNKLKKREIRGRRLRRQSFSRSPGQATQQSPIVTPTRDRDTTMENTMDWQSSTPTRPYPPAGGKRKQSRSRSRPRRSSTTMFVQNQSRPGTAQSTDSCVSQTSNANHSHNYNHQQQFYQHHFSAASAPAFGSPAQPRCSAEIDSESAAAAADCMEGVEFVVPSFHFPGRVRPGVPLAVVPDANRGIPTVPTIPGEYRDAKAVGVNVSVSDRGENSMDTMAIDGGGGAWSSPQVLY